MIGENVEVTIKGVPQGDLISPYLFNVNLEEA
jgi:hypothetical protein